MVEKVVIFASATARVEFGLAVNYPRVKPTYAEFKERTELRALETVKGRRPYLQKEFEPFNSYFGQCMIALRQNKDATLEKIVKKEFEKL